MYCFRKPRRRAGWQRIERGRAGKPDSLHLANRLFPERGHVSLLGHSDSHAGQGGWVLWGRRKAPRPDAQRAVEGDARRRSVRAVWRDGSASQARQQRREPRQPRAAGRRQHLQRDSRVVRRCCGVPLHQVPSEAGLRGHGCAQRVRRRRLVAQPCEQRHELGRRAQVHLESLVLEPARQRGDVVSHKAAVHNPRRSVRCGDVPRSRVEHLAEPDGARATRESHPGWLPLDAAAGQQEREKRGCVVVNAKHAGYQKTRAIYYTRLTSVYETADAPAQYIQNTRDTPRTWMRA